jgi:PAS domain S-box-containing protein
MNSLITRVSALTISVILLTGIVLTAVNIQIASTALVEIETEDFRTQTARLGKLLEESLEQAVLDARLIATSPHLLNFSPWLKAGVEGGIPPAPPAAVTRYLSEVAALDRDLYQVRLLDVAGWERARVNRVEGEVRVVPPDELQFKGDRPYFEQARTLPRDGVYVSEVERNVERGEVEIPYVPVCRVGVPVFGPTEELVAVVVMNLDLRPLVLRSIGTELSETEVAILSAGGLPLWSLGEEGSKLKPLEGLTRQFSLNDEESVSVRRMTIGALPCLVGRAKLSAATPAGTRHLGILRVVPYDTLTIAARDTRRTSIAFLVPVIVIMGILSSLATYRYLRPRLRLAEVLRRKGAEVQPEDLPEVADHEGRILRDALCRTLGELRAKEERLLLATEGGSDGLWDWFDVEKEDEWWSPTFYHILGYENGEIPSTVSMFRELLHPDDTHSTFTAVRRQLEQGVPFDVEYRLRTRSGAYRWYRSRASLFVKPDGTRRIAGSLQDIHARKTAEESRDRYEQQLHLSIEELNRFAYIASHDLKAPLRAIDNLAQWIHKDCHDILPEQQRVYLEKMRGRIDRMERLLTDLLQYSRAGRKRGRQETVDVGTFLREVCDFLDIPKTYRLEIEEPMPRAKLYITPFKHVVQNLIGNAVKHHDRSQGTVRCACTFEEDTLYLTISDDGPGIPIRMHKKVFELFQTLQSRDHVEGSGLGLAIVKKLVDTEGGSIRIEPRDGRGTTFHLVWPLEEHARVKAG